MKARSGSKKTADPHTSAPTFRPMEAQLKKLAEEQRKADAAAKKSAAAIEPKAVGKGSSSKVAPQPRAVAAIAPRVSSLTAQEQRELASLKAQPGDDEFFFQRLMGGVRPLEESKTGRVTTAPEIKAKPRDVDTAAHARADDAVREHLMTLVEGAARFEVSDDGVRLEGRRLDLGGESWRRLRRGELPIDARLDLHGLHAEEARASLDRFLAEKRAHKDRVALVIHGRGEHSPAGIGVLRGEIAAWLSQGRSSQHVAAFATAREDDGGRGALYVLLRP